jgi:hypothetical protein
MQFTPSRIVRSVLPSIARDRPDAQKGEVIMSDKTPRNQEGQPPTKTPDETIDRLEQKKGEGRGDANRERIEQQEREVSSER